MKKTDLFISPKDYFTELVENGLSRRKVRTYPAVKDYLVSMLQHYMIVENLDTTETLAEMYLKAHQAELPTRQELLKKLGDNSLYISGFFGDSLQRKIVDIDYYAEMGGAAYGGLADCVKQDTTAAVYRVFSSRFLEFVDVLTYISQQSFVQNDASILRLYDRYLRTGSELAKEKLLEMGVLTLSKDQIKLAKQD